MSDTILNITDSGLLDQLKKSYISNEQKKELEPLIPSMTEDERKELLALIEQSKQEATVVEKEYEENLGKLNKEYTEKMVNLNKEHLDKARKNLEKMDKDEIAEELKVVEGEILTINTEIKATDKSNKKRGGHALRNLFLILLFLLILGGGALYALQYLSNT